VLYDVNRRVLAALPASTRGASYIAATAEGAVAPTGFAERLAALVDEYVPDSAEGQRTAARHRLARRLLDDPVTYHDELTEEERQYLATQRGPMSARLAQATGFVSELRAEGVALVDPDSELTDERLPAVGTEAHATLLVAEYLAHAAGAADDGGGQRAAPPGTDAAPTGTAGGAGMLHSLAELAAFLREAADEYGRYWRKAAREPGAEAELAAQAVARLERLKLVRRVDEAIEARPALFRYRVHAAEVQSQQALL
jgi:uncharacterized protein (TIGR02678 family)